jgi:AraC family transcriptional regulator of adaptative response/methylated-DNA-[protein]-cysteine methyltransferase
MSPDRTIDDTQARHYALVEQAIAYLREHARNQPSLEALASALHVSPFHLQRTFAEWAGISPKRFLQYLTKEHAKRRLAGQADTLSVADDVGLSSTSRLHELMVSCEAMTPGEYKLAGQGLTIGYGFAPSPFGRALAAWTPRGVCYFAFCVDGDDAMVAELAALWPRAVLARDDAGALALLQQMFPSAPTRGRVHLVLRGTNFQIKVWEALVHTEFGQVLSYQRLAQRIGAPRASRAVGSAVAANTIGYLIPCHRVIRESGDTGQYRWGPQRKQALLAWESALS